MSTIAFGSPAAAEIPHEPVVVMFVQTCLSVRAPQHADADLLLGSRRVDHPHVIERRARRR